MSDKTYARLVSIRANLTTLQGGELSLGERRLVDAIKRDVTACISEEATAWMGGEEGTAWMSKYYRRNRDDK